MSNNAVFERMLVASLAGLFLWRWLTRLSRASSSDGGTPINDLVGLEAHLEGDNVQIRLEGELDPRVLPEVRKQMLQALDLGPGAVGLDLRGVTFIGSPGLNLIAKVAKQLRSEKRTVRRVTNRWLGRLLEISGLALILNVTVED